MSERRKGYIEVRPEMVGGNRVILYAGPRWLSDGAWMARRDAFIGEGLTQIALASVGVAVAVLPDAHVKSVLAQWTGHRTEFRCTDILVSRPAAGTEESEGSYAHRAYLSDAGEIAWVDDLYCRRLEFGDAPLYGVRYTDKHGKAGWMLGDAPTQAYVNVIVANVAAYFEDRAATEMLDVATAIRISAARARTASSIQEVDDGA